MTRQQAMHAFIIVLACFLLCAIMPPARAQLPPSDLPDSVMTAKELHGLCTSKYDTDVGFCTGYVTAVANRMALSSIDGYGPCNFAAARSQQFTDLFTAYAQSYPDSLHAPADSIIVAALGRAFPCHQGAR